MAGATHKTFSRGNITETELYHYTAPAGVTTYPLTWDHSGEHYYETGVEQCVLFLANSNPSTAQSFVGEAESGGTAPTITIGTSHGYYGGVAWNGITSCQQTPDGADTEDLYADNDIYLKMRGKETFGGSIGAYTYPDMWAKCDGTASPIKGMRLHGQTRQAFGLAYLTKEGNDIDFQDHAYKLHLIYGATASPSDREYTTINDSPEALEFSWDYECTPIEAVINGTTYTKTAYIEISSGDCSAKGWQNLMNAIQGGYSNDGTQYVAAFLPSPSEVYTLLNVSAS